MSRRSLSQQQQEKEQWNRDEHQYIPTREKRRSNPGVQLIQPELLIDIDGEEINMHIPQTHEAIQEAIRPLKAVPTHHAEQQHFDRSVRPSTSVDSYNNTINYNKFRR